MAKGSLEILKNKIDVSKVLEQLNAALSEEWLSFYQYWIGSSYGRRRYASRNSKRAAKHAEAEYKHAKLVADRIIELEGVPVLNPKKWFELARCQYSAPDDFDVQKILFQNVIAETMRHKTLRRYSLIYRRNRLYYL